MDLSSRPEFALEPALQLREADGEQVEAQQVKLLAKHLGQAAKVPFYKDLFSQLGFSPEEISATSDLARLPLTSRDDMARDPSLFATPAATADIALTSGTSGEPLVVPYSQRDLSRLAFNETMAFYGAGIRAGDKVLLTVTLDRCFIAGLAYYSGLVALGAAAIRSGPGQPARQWHIIKKLRPRAIVGVPSFLRKLAAWGRDNGLDCRAWGVEALITIGEPIRKADLSLAPLGQELEEAWGAKVYASYGATELETAFGECLASCGGHIHPELMIAEIVDDAGLAVPDGQPGELVVTPLGVAGFPLVRFRTGDVARIHGDPCPCGWQTKRLGPIEGRLAQRLKYKGTTLYPETIFHALQECGAHTAYVEIRAGADLSDEVTVVVASAAPGQQGEKQRVADTLQAHLRVRPQVVVKEESEVLAVMGRDGGRKPKKFFDFRA